MIPTSKSFVALKFSSYRRCSKDKKSLYRPIPRLKMLQVPHHDTHFFYLTSILLNATPNLVLGCSRGALFGLDMRFDPKCHIMSLPHVT